MEHDLAQKMKTHYHYPEKSALNFMYEKLNMEINTNLGLKIRHQENI